VFAFTDKSFGFDLTIDRVQLGKMTQFITSSGEKKKRGNFALKIIYLHVEALAFSEPNIVRMYCGGLHNHWTKCFFIPFYGFGLANKGLAILFLILPWFS
jgi:hypothetical protein